MSGVTIPIPIPTAIYISTKPIGSTRSSRPHFTKIEANGTATAHIPITKDSIMGYKMKALVWDLYHYTIEPVSLSRLETAVKSLYFIGPPYFNPDQTALILTALTRKYNGNDNPSPWAETVKDSLGVCIKAYLIDWPQREKLDAYELAHIFMFVFGVTFMDLGAPEFQDSLHTNGV
ncbi:hypothetical protein K445DRAFT_23154 [Daldinia sp. EC12]|nr:hypothetical protein K445DRAFT_23154 [Daldinia sp. EC12]